jgi:hypothetical protein
MGFKEFDFIRNPVVQNEVFFLESKCAFCGFSILARSIEELVDHEKLHRKHGARQTQLHKRTPMRSVVLYSQVVKILMEELFWILSRTCSPSEPSYGART